VAESILDIQHHQFDNIELLAKQVVEGFIIGLHKSPFHGFSVEFAEHRLYNPGDPIKNIDWKVYARTDKTFIKRFEEETNLRCQIVLDASSSMYYPEDEDSETIDKNKLTFSALSASAIMHMLRKQRDAGGLSIFSDEIETHTKARSTIQHNRILMQHMNDVLTRTNRNVRTSAAKSLHQIAENIHRRSMVAIFSDMFDSEENIEDLFSALQHLKHNKHEVILFHTVDQSKEIEFEFSNRPYLFIDMETGEKVKLHSNKIKDQYAKKMREFKDQVRLRCLQYKIDFVEADINKGFRQVLLPYLAKRHKMI